MGRAALASLALSVGLGCATDVGVAFGSAQETQRELTESAVAGGEISSFTRATLQLTGQTKRWREDPAGAIDAIYRLRESVGTPPSFYFSLAELSFAEAARTRDPDRYLAAAVFAWAFLFPSGEDPPPEPLDPRLRVAADLYNRGLTEALATNGGRAIEPEAGTRRVSPYGTLTVRIDDAGLAYGGFRLGDFLPAADLLVTGLRMRNRLPGLGAPLAALVLDDTDTPAGKQDRLMRGWRIPVTAILDLGDARAGLRAGHLEGVLRFYPLGGREQVEIDGSPVPIESEPSAALAASLQERPFAWLELKAFVAQEPDALLLKNQLSMMTPHVRGRVPVVLIHGTASSPARWADMINDLERDPVVRSRTEFWLFTYNTGNPILYTAGLLRAQLRSLVEQLDPQGTDPGLHRIVVVGHSQGGLLAKLMVIDSGERFWSPLSDRPPAALGLGAENTALLERTFLFRRLPFVTRAIFLATPQHGSYLAARRLGELAARLVTLPLDVARIGRELITATGQTQRLMRMGRLATSVDNMAPGSEFIRVLASIPVPPPVVANSIIPVLGEGPLEDATDGVVRYTSAHIPEVESELVIREQGHSVQGNPLASLEVRRLLREHVGEPVVARVQ